MRLIYIKRPRKRNRGKSEALDSDSMVFDVVSKADVCASRVRVASFFLSQVSRLLCSSL